MNLQKDARRNDRNLEPLTDGRAGLAP